MQTGVILVNTAEDYPEDRQMGVRTAILALGLWRGISAALVLTVVGSAGMIVSLLVFFPRPECLTCTLSCVVPLALAAMLVCAALIARLRWRMQRPRRGSMRSPRSRPAPLGAGVDHGAGGDEPAGRGAAACGILEPGCRMTALCEPPGASYN